MYTTYKNGRTFTKQHKSHKNHPAYNDGNASCVTPQVHVRYCVTLLLHDTCVSHASLRGIKGE